MRALSCSFVAQAAASRASGKSVAAEIGRQRLGHDHAAGRIDRDPIAVKRHFDAAVGAEARVGLPGDVGEQAGGAGAAAAFRRVVEQRRDPCVEQVAVLAEAMLAAAGIARLLDQRVDAARRSASSLE